MTAHEALHYCLSFLKVRLAVKTQHAVCQPGCNPGCLYWTAGAGDHGRLEVLHHLIVRPDHATVDCCYCYSVTCLMCLLHTHYQTLLVWKVSQLAESHCCDSWLQPHWAVHFGQKHPAVFQRMAAAAAGAVTCSPLL